MIELGAHTLPYRAHCFERALEGIARAGFTSLGIWNDHAGGPVVAADASATAIAAVRRQIEQAGLQPRMCFRFPSDETDPVAQLRRSVDVAAQLGIPFVLSSGPGPYLRRTFEARKRDMLFRRECDTYFAALRAIAPIAASAGVTMVVKPHMGVTGTGEDLADIVELIDHPAVRVCYDAGNIAFYEGLAPEEDVKTCARYVSAVCVKDHRGARGVADFPVPGEGDIDHAALFRTLIDAGFSGPALVERVDGTQNASEMPVETIDAALERARRSLERAVERAQTASMVRG